MSYLYLVTCLRRKFGNVIHCTVLKHEDVDIFQLRKLEKISVKIGKAELDNIFQNNCKLYKIFPKFLCFNLPGEN